VDSDLEVRVEKW